MPSRDDHGYPDEGGATLILVIVFLLIAGLLIGSLLSSGSSSEILVSQQLKSHADDYAADAGIEYGIQELRSGQWCQDTFQSNSATTSIDGANVTVTCTATSGSLTEPSNWAVVTLDPGSTSLQIQSGASVTKQVLGPTYLNGGIQFVGGTKFEADSQSFGDNAGYVLQSTPPCTSKPGGFTGTAAQWICNNPSTQVSVPNPSLALPPTVPANARASIVNGSCTTFFPGKYSSINLNTNNYFISGVYYFDNLSISLANGQSLYGGKNDGPDGESVLTSPGPCDTDAAHGVSDGTGVEIVLGGTSSLDAGKGTLELFQRVTPQSSVPTEGDALGVSIRTVPCGAAGWDTPAACSLSGAAQAAAFSANVCLNVGNGNNPEMVIHGAVNCPNESVSLFATNSSAAQILDGVVTWDLSVQASASASGLVVATQTSPTRRVITLTSSVPYGKLITARARVEIANDGNATPIIDSWWLSNP